MGCGTSNSRKLAQRLDEFELKQHTKTICINNQEVTVYLPQHRVGDYFAVEIANKDYYYFEERFKELVGKELSANKAGLLLASKEAFITSILRDERLRKGVLRVVRRKGIMHAYRWKTWYLLAIYDDRFKPDGAMHSMRQELYSALNKKQDKEVEEIVTKDVMRTSRHKELFKDIDSVGNLQLYRVCKAIGKFFPASGYIQGMNFVAAFVLQVSGMDEFETFNFIVSLWKKEKNLFYGMYEPGFPVLYFMKYAFERLLELTNRKVHRVVAKLAFPAELWIVKWFISFFTFALEKEYVLRIFDYLMVNDVFGPVCVALAIASQLTNVFDTEDFVLIGDVVQSRERLTSTISFSKFVKNLKDLDFDRKVKLNILRDYHKTLEGDKRARFSPYFEKFEKRLMKSQLDFHDDFGFDKSCYDYDKIGAKKLNAQITAERDMETHPRDASAKENDTRRSFKGRGSLLRKFKGDTAEGLGLCSKNGSMEDSRDAKFLNMR